MVPIRLHTQLRLFEFVNLGIYGSEFAVVCGAIRLTSCSIGDALERLHIYLYGQIVVLDEAVVVHRIRCRTIRTHTDGIHAYAKGLCYLC